MNVHDFRDFVFDLLAEPLARMDCAGPPECEDQECVEVAKHDTSLCMSGGVIEATIDDRTFRIRIDEHKVV